jgi:hypothetical protein
VSHLRHQTKAQFDENLAQTKTEYMFILGGLAVSDDDSNPITGGTRARNDVWSTTDGISWVRVSPTSGGNTMPWGPRAFHGCVASSGLTEMSSDRRIGNSTSPLIIITGGGYMGRHENNEVRALEAYTDTWVSRDVGRADWTRINYEEGSKNDENLFSTNEWTETIIKGRKIYRGKWGHTIMARVDYSTDNQNGTLDYTDKTPSLFVIGGKIESGPMVNDVFMSENGFH